MLKIQRIKNKDPNQEIIIKLNVKKPSAKSLLKEGSGTIEDLNLSSQTTYIEELPDGSNIEWVLPHSKGFVNFINKHFGENPEYYSNKTSFIDDIKKAIESGADAPPFAYQKFIRDYMRYGTPYRGMLLEHGLGSGKSRSAVMVAETFREQGLPILILTPAFLRLNFLDEIKRWGGPDIRITEDMDSAEIQKRTTRINNSYKFAHYNASGHGFTRDKAGNNVSGKGSVYEQLARIGIGFEREDPEYGNVFPYLNNKYPGLKPPERMLIIIEEIHGLNRAFIKGHEKLRYFMYPLLMKAKDCKIIGLSGTPIANSPFEMATLYNLLRGPMKGDGRAMPEEEGTFNDFFVDYAALKIRNVNVMATRILGLGSLFKGITYDKERVIYPFGKESKHHIIRKLELPEYQARYHDLILSDEKNITKKRKLQNLGRKDVVAAISEAQAELEPPGSYYVRSRQAANFAFPEEIPRPRPRSKGSWSGLKDYIFEFNVNGELVNIGQLQFVWDFLKGQGMLLDDYIDEWEAAIQMDDTDAGRKVLSEIIKFAYNHDPPIKARHATVKTRIFSDGDYREIMRHLGDYKQRLQATVEILLERADEFLTIDKLENMYSAKMADIYKTIITDTQNGAVYVDYSSNPEQMHEQEENIERDQGTELGQDEEEGDDENVDFSNFNVNQIKDPSDPFREKKYQDAYLPDSEIKGRVRGGPALVYSFFNSIEGVGIFSKVLEAHGFSQYKPNDSPDPKTLKRLPRFAFVKGGMDANFKARIMTVFNSKQNAHGQLIRVIFVTQAAAEGISLFSLRQIHIMEPHWENGMIDQVIGRGFRLLSHRYLSDSDERRIQVYRYFARTTGFKDATADGIVQAIADKKSVLIDQLRTARAMSAVDCNLNSDYNQLNVPCLNFLGNQTGLAFTGSITTDINRQEKVKERIEKYKYNVVTVGNDTYIEEPKTIRLEIMKRDGQKAIMTGNVLYKMTTKWKPGETIDERALEKYGYKLIVADKIVAARKSHKIHEL